MKPKIEKSELIAEIATTSNLNEEEVARVLENLEKISNMAPESKSSSSNIDSSNDANIEIQDTQKENLTPDTASTSSKENSSAFITFACESCGQVIEAETSMAGEKSNCPTCGLMVSIPDTSTPQPQSEISAPDFESSSMTMRIDLLDL